MKSFLFFLINYFLNCVLCVNFMKSFEFFLNSYLLSSIFKKICRKSIFNFFTFLFYTFVLITSYFLLLEKQFDFFFCYTKNIQKPQFAYFENSFKLNKMQMFKNSFTFPYPPSNLFSFNKQICKMKTAIRALNLYPKYFSRPFGSFTYAFIMYSAKNDCNSAIIKGKERSFFSTSPYSSSLYVSPNANDIQQKVKTNNYSAVSASGLNSAESSRFYMSERSINRVSLLGRLGYDCEAKFLHSGEKFATLNVATSDSWRDKLNGEVRTRTDWHRVVIFDSTLAEYAEKFAKKGRKVYVEGSLQTRRWQGADGTERYTTEVVISKFRGELILIDNINKGNDVNNIEENETTNFNKFNNNLKNTNSASLSLNTNITKQSGGLYNRVINNSDYFDGTVNTFER